MISTRDKKLLRNLKEEGFNYVDYEDELVTSELIADYNKSSGIPLKYWSYEELKTRYEELIQISYKLSILFPEYYRYQWYYQNREQWAILEEMETIAQMYNIDIYGD